MHRGHDYEHHGDGASQGVQYGGVGHNHAQRSRAAAQWQTPHLNGGDDAADSDERDIDKVETAFVEGFMQASDPTSFLRLAQVPFDIAAADGAKLDLLRVEVDAVTDVGSLTPHLGGQSFRYDPLPAALVSRRRRLRLVYFDGAELRRLTFAQARALGQSRAG
jgi:hypothetical protein